MVEIKSSLEIVTECDFLVSTIRVKKWSYFQHLVSSFSDVLYVEEMSEIRPEQPFSRPYVRCASTLFHLRRILFSDARSVEHTSKFSLYYSSLFTQSDLFCVQGNLGERSANVH